MHMIQDWERSTRQCDYAQLRPQVRQAIDSAVSALAEPVDYVFCIETASTRIRPGGIFSGRRKSLYHAVILTPDWLIQAIDPDDGKTEPLVIFNNYQKMVIREDTVNECKRHGIKEYGIDIVSQTNRDVSTGSYFIGLEHGPAARQFLITLKLFIRSANLPPRAASE